MIGFKLHYHKYETCQSIILLKKPSCKLCLYIITILEDVQQLRATINELISEAGTEVQAEAEQIKEHYNNRIKSVLFDMRRLQTENKSKNLQIQKLKNDLSCTEAELQRTKRELDTAIRDRPSFSALDRKLEGFFRTQELVGGESVRADLEIDQLKTELVRLTQR